MNDTNGWYGFDLDGTLAKYDKWKGIDYIGEPVKPMVNLVKKLHAEGKTVKIVTARISPRMIGDTHASGCQCGRCNEEAAKGPYLQEDYIPVLENGSTVKMKASDYICGWCAKHLGFVPEIVCQKDNLMITLYDDRVKQVETNTGLLVEDAMNKAFRLAESADKSFHTIYERHLELGARFDAKIWKWQLAFIIGMLLSGLIFTAVNVMADRIRERTPQLIAVERLLDAAKDAQEALR